MYQDNPPPYTAAPPPPGMAPSGPPPPGVKPDFMSTNAYSYPPPQPNTQTSQTHVIITSGPSVVLGPLPQPMVCPSCNSQIVTSVKTEPNSKTHLFALLLCLFQCWLCCCIPYCIDSCQSQNHFCPHCDAFLGSYQN